MAFYSSEEPPEDGTIILYFPSRQVSPQWYWGMLALGKWGKGRSMDLVCFAITTLIV